MQQMLASNVCTTENWSRPRSLINQKLLLVQTFGKQKTRHIPNVLLLRAQRAVLDYGLTLDVVRIRFQQFRSDADAVAKVCGATLLRTAFKATEPGPAMLRFLEGEYITTEPGRVRVLSGGKMQYKQQSTWITAAGKYKWSSKHKGLFIVGGGGGWRLDVTKSTDNTIVWINVKDVTEDGWCTIADRVQQASCAASLQKTMFRRRFR